MRNERYNSFLEFALPIPFLLILAVSCAIHFPETSKLDWILLGSSTFLVWIATGPSSISTLMLIRKIQKKELLPEKITDFPLQKTSEENYKLSKQKVASFMQSLTVKEQAELVLSQAELNHLYLRGRTIDQYAAYFTGLQIFANEYFHFEIRDGYIWLRSICYPDNGGWDGTTTETKRINFTNSEGIHLEEILIAELNGRDMTVPWLPKYRDYIVFDLPPYQRNNSLDESYTLLCFFGAIPTPNSRLDDFRDDVEYQNAVEVIKKITQIKVTDQSLVIKAGNVQN
jgi:hypothetical protein